MNASKIAFLSPGQGKKSVEPGMCYKLFNKFDWVQDLFFEAGKFLNLPLTEICFSDPDGRLSETIIAQPASFVVDVAYAEFLNDHGTFADCWAGHSAGYIAVLVQSRIIDFHQGLMIIQERARLMAEACKKNPGRMMVLLNPKMRSIENFCAKFGVSLANWNGRTQYVLSGGLKQMHRAEKTIRKQKLAGRIIDPGTEGAFHSDLMESVCDPFASFLEKIPFSDPPEGTFIIANSNAEIISTGEEAKEETVKQITSTVLWYPTMRKLVEKGVRTIHEVGHGQVLSGLVKRDFGKKLEVFSAQKMLETA